VRSPTSERPVSALDSMASDVSFDDVVLLQGQPSCFADLVRFEIARNTPRGPVPLTLTLRNAEILVVSPISHENEPHGSRDDTRIAIRLPDATEHGKVQQLEMQLQRLWAGVATKAGLEKATRPELFRAPSRDQYQPLLKATLRPERCPIWVAATPDGENDVVLSRKTDARQFLESQRRSFSGDLILHVKCVSALRGNVPVLSEVSVLRARPRRREDETFFSASPIKSLRYAPGAGADPDPHPEPDPRATVIEAEASAPSVRQQESKSKCEEQDKKESQDKRQRDDEEEDPRDSKTGEEDERKGSSKASGSLFVNDFCVFCLSDGTASWCFMPCRHVCICDQCAPNFAKTKRCPLCNVDSESLRSVHTQDQDQDAMAGTARSDLEDAYIHKPKDQKNPLCD